MVNGVSGSTYTTAAASTTSANTKATESTVAAKNDDTAVVYEKSSAGSSTRKSGKANREVMAKLQAASDARLASLKSLVEKVITKQGQTYAAANPSDLLNDSSFWNAIRTGNFKVDAATAAQAKADIAEDGYWGVNQTSDRLVEFAKAAAGGDSEKIEKMRKAIQKGFDAAKKLWGGELPGISQQTYDATMKKMDEWAKEAGIAE